MMSVRSVFAPSQSLSAGSGEAGAAAAAGAAEALAEGEAAAGALDAGGAGVADAAALADVVVAADVSAPAGGGSLLHAARVNANRAKHRFSRRMARL